MKDRIRGWTRSLLVFKYRIQVIHLEFWNIVKAEPLFQNSIIVFLLLCDMIPGNPTRSWVPKIRQMWQAQVGLFHYYSLTTETVQVIRVTDFPTDLY